MADLSIKLAWRGMRTFEVATWLFYRECHLLLFSVVSTDRSSWRLVFLHHLAMSAAIWDVAFLTERHLLVLQAVENPTAVVCTLSTVDGASVKVLVVETEHFNKVFNNAWVWVWAVCKSCWMLGILNVCNSWSRRGAGWANAEPLIVTVWIDWLSKV